MKTEMGVVIYIYSKDPPDYIYSKYVWVHGSNSLDSSASAEISFLAFLAFKRKGGVARWEPAHATPKVKSYMHTKF